MLSRSQILFNTSCLNLRRVFFVSRYTSVRFASRRPIKSIIQTSPPPPPTSSPPHRFWTRFKAIIYWQLFGGAVLILAMASYFVYWYTNLEPVPFPGIDRYQFVCFVDEEKLKERGDKQIYEMIQEHKILPNDHPVTKKVMSIGNRILALSQIDCVKDVEWKFMVVDAPDRVTCITSPSGVIVFFTGLFRACSDDNLIAVVLGHEIGHIIARHPKEQASSIWFWFQKHYNVKHTQIIESEADYIGLMLLARACYDPREAPKLWINMAKLLPDQTTPGHENYLFTHPPHSTREKNLESWIPLAMKERSKYCPLYRR